MPLGSRCLSTAFLALFLFVVVTCAGESGAGAPLGAVVEEPPLEDDAFQRLADHIGVNAVIVEAVWRLVSVRTNVAGRCVPHAHPAIIPTL